MPFTPRRVGGVAYSLVMFVVVSVLSGVLIAGLFVPVAGLAGVSSKAAADELDNLPAELATPAPPTRSKVLMANGKILGVLLRREPHLREARQDRSGDAAGAARDRGPPLLRARRARPQGHAAGPGPQLRQRRSTQGGSSITQQYVKMVQIEACQATRATTTCTKAVQAPTIERKIRELRYAIALEKRLTKDQILERYLNIAYYGEGAYGVEAAARHYFSTTRRQADPGRRRRCSPGWCRTRTPTTRCDNPGAALDRRDVVINRMAELKMITAEQVRGGQEGEVRQEAR